MTTILLWISQAIAIYASVLALSVLYLAHRKRQAVKSAPYKTQIQYFDSGYIAELDYREVRAKSPQPWCLYQVTDRAGRKKIKLIFYCSSLAECKELVDHL